MWDIFKSEHTKNCEKKDKLIEFYEMVHKNLISILKSECVNGETLYNTKFGMAAQQQMTMKKSWYCNFSSYFETPFYDEYSQQKELDRAESHKNDIMKEYIDIVEKYIPIAKEKITNNLRDFRIFAHNTPKFLYIS